MRRRLSLRRISHRIRSHGHRALSAAGPTRWVVEGTVPRLSGRRRLHRRYERKPEHTLASTAIATTLLCHRRITR
ncbi:transposase [Streptomyces alfalfae]|uniref:Transposase n=1 Tax=Streptomyces alfalfae TaxID=1642299 RepID=A0A7T4PPZ7_9ACTN|nr:transposase [Streptomyces alfalfae]